MAGSRTPTRLAKDALVSVVLPVYNEANVLRTLCQRVASAIAPACPRFEIIFVNDGSQDGSARILDELAAQDNHVRVVHFSRNFGHQAAVQAGLAHARGDVVVLMDSDLQDSPEALPRFLAEWEAGYDVVYAVRTDRPENPIKRFLFAAFYRLLGAISSTRMPPDAGNFGLIDRRVACEIVALAERDRYFPGLRSWVGFQQKGIKVRRSERYDNVPRVSLLGLWRLAKGAIFSFSTVPLQVFYLIGWSAMALFLGLGAYSLGAKLFTDLAIPGWTSNVLVASFFGAVNALGISILGEYVVRVYDQVRGRPMFVIDRRVNFSVQSAVKPAMAQAPQDPNRAASETADKRLVLLDELDGLLEHEARR
jgi:dolichol-phosphate mannosyltransferase